ncbi:hypothetical protein CDV31_003892 [Fusarium ambrosium]|uniref:Uncharacterized protein n=1 Tax=Fusarium ambrosium TaxID=131363 RepID=A0A428USV1_9HYPO|nr:hypothetical protein CDV31_003892 [Fusarium ambrosium]
MVDGLDLHLGQPSGESQRPGPWLDMDSMFNHNKYMLAQNGWNSRDKISVQDLHFRFKSP